MKSRVDVSIIITAWKEPLTVSVLIKEILRQINELSDGISFEILLVCPDIETRDAGISSDSANLVNWIQDEGNGKPAALNKVFSLAKGDWWVMTDGDVLWGNSVLKEFLKKINDENVGGLTGRPLSVNDRNNIMGYWSHLLTSMAHNQRLRRNCQNRFLVASGYLMCLRNDIVKSVPENVLSDDAFISYMINKKKFLIKYVPEAEVFVKFPTNFKDWIKQKSRSGGGYKQLSEFIEIPRDKMRSFENELKDILEVLSYAKNIREFYWTVLLLLARLYLWLKIFWERKVINKSFAKTWTRIESTK